MDGTARFFLRRRRNTARGFTRSVKAPVRRPQRSFVKDINSGGEIVPHPIISPRQRHDYSDGMDGIYG